MPAKKLAGGTVHKLPSDFRKTLASDPKAPKTWDDITPLARKEWICWVTSAKKQETRDKRLEWARENFSDSKRHSCSPHR